MRCLHREQNKQHFRRSQEKKKTNKEKKIKRKEKKKEKKKKNQRHSKGNKNYGTRDSRMVTHCSTNLAIPRLTRAERTGSRAFMVL